MIQEIDIQEYFRSELPLIDVRSPSEYDKGHIPGATNVPLFTDAERAHVGTVYTRQSSEKAMEQAFQYVNPKRDLFLAESRKIAMDGRVAVHCWRGGMRSAAFAQHLEDHGFQQVLVIRGGYKAYRSYLHDAFDLPLDIRIVGGYTGSGKTKVIAQLQRRCLQAIDLEELAGHKGSAFGTIEGRLQPTTEQFENDLFHAWRRIDPSQPVWLEDESHNIGGVNIPMNLYRQMQAAIVYFLDIPREERAKFLVPDYAAVSKPMLADSVRRISRRLGGQNAQQALHLIEDNKLYEAALICLRYYDKSYERGLRLHDQQKIIHIPMPGTDSVENANAILNTLHEQENLKQKTTWSNKKT